MSSGSGNMAGFGARRFMQDMYQQHSAPSHSNAGHDRHNVAPTSAAYQQPSTIHHQHHYETRQRAHPTTAHDAYHRHRPSHDAVVDRSTDSQSSRKAQPTQSKRDAQYSQHHHYDQRQQSAYANKPYAPASAAAASKRDPPSNPPTRSDTLLSSTTDSTVCLAYAQSNDSAYQSSNYLRTNDHPSSRRSQANRVADRNTVYDDDYEEPAHYSSVDEIARAPSPASATRGDESTDVSFTIVRATVLEPDLPKAKCADCGDTLAFEELATHTCQAASASKLPLLTIQVPPSSSSSVASSTATSPAVATPRSPFFDRYDNILSENGPTSPSLFYTAGSGSDSKREQEAPTAHAVKIIGTQPAVKVSNIKVPQSAHLHAERGSTSVKPPSIQRSASDTAADAAARRKMIEQQRAAKKKDMMASSMPKAATVVGLSTQALSPPNSASTKQTGALAASEGQHAKKESSSSISSTCTDSSDRNGARMDRAKRPHHRRGHEESSTANITPSSSYERICEGNGRGTPKLPPSNSQPVAAKQSRDRANVDLSSIEEMMKGLTASPEPLQRRLTEETHARTAGGPSATEASKSERERTLELELERLRDKERTRQLQALRLKEKKRKERAAKRCCVCDCSLSSSRTPFVERDGKLLCARDWKELYLPKCRKCNLSVEKGAVKSSDGALRGVFHRACFACAACEAPFTDGSFYVFNNQPYCSRHYHRLNGSLCRECETGIEGDCRQTDTGDRFHPHCFRCQYSSKNGACQAALAEYYVVGGQRLCERHADKVGRRLAKAGQRQVDLRAQKRMTMLRSLR